MNDLPSSFAALIRDSEVPVLVDFYADWCGPCKMVAPVIARVAREFKGRIVTVKVDTERRPTIANTWNIQSIPTLMMFHKGRQLMRLSGAHPFPRLKDEVEKALAAM